MIGALHDIPNREAFQSVEVIQCLPQDSQRGGIVGVTAGDGIRPCRRDLFTYPVENREADREGQAALVRTARGEASGDPDDRTADFAAAGPAADPGFRAAF